MKESYVRKFERLARSKSLGILQADIAFRPRFGKVAAWRINFCSDKQNA